VPGNCYAEGKEMFDMAGTTKTMPAKKSKNKVAAKTKKKPIKS
jgi:hypothetical protein